MTHSLFGAPAGKASKAAPKAAATDAAGGDTEGSGGPTVIELNGQKRTATVGSFKGTVMVNIREYYEVRVAAQPGPQESAVGWQCEAVARHASVINSFKQLAVPIGTSCLMAMMLLPVAWCDVLSLVLLAAQAGGEMRPGKKGISLVASQFEALVAAAPTVSHALESRDVAFSAPISSKCAPRRCTRTHRVLGRC